MKILATVVFTAALSTTAMADTYSTSALLGPKTNEGIEYDVFYNDFDTTRGTLVSATLRLLGTYNASISTNSTPTSEVAMFSPSILQAATIQVGNFGPHSAPFVGRTATASFSFNVNAELPNALFTGNSPTRLDAFTIVGSQRVTNSVTVSGSDVQERSFLSNVFGLISYNYTPFAVADVPEPASMALLGVGMLGSALVRRRKSA